MYKSVSNLLYSLEKFVYYKPPQRNKYLDFLVELLRQMFFGLILITFYVVLIFLFDYLSNNNKSRVEMTPIAVFGALCL